MKKIGNVLLILLIIGIIVLVFYLLRNTEFGGKVWVQIAAVYNGLLIVFAKIKGFFFGNDEKADELQDRLDKLNAVENELIDKLWKERELMKEKLAKLQSEQSQLESTLQSQTQNLNNYTDLETWKQNVWEQMEPEEQNEMIKQTYGRKLSDEELYSFN